MKERKKGAQATVNSIIVEIVPNLLVATHVKLVDVWKFAMTRVLLPLGCPSKSMYGISVSLQCTCGSGKPPAEHMTFKSAPHSTFRFSSFAVKYGATTRILKVTTTSYQNMHLL